MTSEKSKKVIKSAEVNEAGGELSSRADVDNFLAQVQSMPVVSKTGNGRLIFAMDATMSRQPTWDTALQTQAEMFAEAGRIGGLDVQLVYFRGFGECRASKWVSNAKALARLMTGVQCRGGNTQIGKVLSHIRREASDGKIDAVVYVGDCMEENVDTLCQAAGEIGLLGTRIFMFQEGNDRTAEAAFREIARLTGGAYSRFDASAAKQLRDLLGAVAVYAAGGRKALQQYADGGKGGVRGLLEQLN